MAEQSPTLAEWRILYEAAIKIKELAPWEWMEEVDVFGVQNPDTDEFGFVSIMGTLGEHYAVAVYLGPEAIYDFWDVQDAGQFGSPERIFETPQLQASFVNRKEIEKKDYETIKKLGFKFRGKYAWPQFRCIQPGFVPWFVEAGEARFLRYTLEQTVDVALRFKEDPELLDPPDDESYLVRVPSKKGNTISWEDRIMPIPPPESESIPVAMDVQLLESLKGVPKTRHNLEIDVFMFPTPIQEKSARPFFPYMLLSVDDKSGMVIGSDLLQPVPSLNTMRGLIPVKVLSTFAKAGIVPKRMSVRSDLLFGLLQPVTKELDITLKLCRRLSSLEDAKQSMFQHFM